MFRQPNETYDEYEKRMQRRADILFPNTLPKSGISKDKKLKNLPLGKSIYDEDDDDDILSLGSPKIKSDLEPLVKEIEKEKAASKNEKSSEHKSRKERTPEEEEEILDLMYPSMRNSGKDKVNKTDDEKSEKDKKENFTGGDAKIPEISDKNEKPVKSEEERNRDALKVLGMDENEYQIKGNTISRKEKPKDYEIINNVKYPKNTDNEKIEKLKQQAKEDRSERLKEDNTEYLKNNAKKEQFAIDHIDNKAVKWGVKKYKNADEAVENLHMSKTDSYLNTEYAKKQKILNNYKGYPQNLHSYFEDKIKEQRGKDALNKTPGVYIDSDIKTLNSLKTALLKDSDFTDKLKKYDKAMKNGYSVNDSINFKDKNWHAALGNADIRDMHVNKNGDIELYVTDTYDFNKGGRTGVPAVGRDRQERGEIKPYFQRYHVIISKDEYNKMMKK